MLKLSEVADAASVMQLGSVYSNLSLLMCITHKPWQDDKTVVVLFVCFLKKLIIKIY